MYFASRVTCKWERKTASSGGGASGLTGLAPGCGALTVKKSSKRSSVLD
jgi:hypothetical protein